MEQAIFRGGLIALTLGGLARWVTHLDDDAVTDINTINYKTFINTVNTGDLLLTSSTEVSSPTRNYTNSLWSHCGIAYWLDNKLYEWSAHGESEQVLNSLGFEGYSGPQLVPVDFLASLSGAVFWRKVGMSEVQRSFVGKAVAKLAYKLQFSSKREFLVYLGRPWVSMFDGVGDGMACPHVVAATYGGAGVIDIDRRLSQYTPKSFCDVGDAKYRVRVGPIKMVLGYDTTTLVNLDKK
jgi:hypothetical protein